MFNNVLRLGKETLIYGTSTIAARLFNFFLVPVYTYYLATADYGVVATVFAFMALINIIYQYGMDQAYLRFRQEDGSLDTFSTPFLAVLGTAFILSAVIFASSPLIAQCLGIGAKNANLIKLSSAVMAIDALNIVPFAKLRFEHRAWHFVGVRTASIIVNVIGNILALAYFKTGVEGIFIAGIFASCTSLFLLAFVIKEDLHFNFDKNLFKKMFAFAWPFVPAGAASILVNVIDKPLLSHLAGLSAVGVYQANFKIGVFMMLVVSMFDQAWRPFFIQESAKENCKEIFAQIFTYFAALSTWVFLGLVFLMPAIIKTSFWGYHLIHQNYWGGIKIIPLVLGGYLFYGFYINFMIAPVLTKKTRVLMWITLGGALASVLTNITVVPRAGIIGAGWAILISYFVMAASLFIFLQKNYPIKYEYRKLSLIFGCVFLMLLLNFYTARFGAAHGVALKVIALCIYPFAMTCVITSKRAAPACGCNK